MNSLDSSAEEKCSLRMTTARIKPAEAATVTTSSHAWTVTLPRGFTTNDHFVPARQRKPHP